MTHSKTIKRPDGEYEIKAWYYPDRGYMTSVRHKKNGRYFPRVVISHPLTPEEIHAAKMELWEKMKPEL